MISYAIKLFSALNENTHPAQLAGATCLGLIFGLTPFWSLHNLVVLLLVCILRININFFILSFTLFSGIAWLVDPWLNNIGTSLLTASSLTSFWTTLYQSDFWRLTHFNNTLTLGSFITASFLAPLVYLITIWAVKRYRQVVLSWINKTKLIRWLKASKWYQRANKLNEFRGSMS